MYSFEFSSIQVVNQATQFNEGFFIWVWYADKIPPHIGCSVNGAYYSLKVNGKDNGITVSKAFQLIHKKAIPTIFVKVKTELNQSSVHLAYESYQQAEPHMSTCLTPITQLFSCLSGVKQLSELLKYLSEQQKMETVFGVNLNNDYRGIRNYNQQDITNRLQILKDVKRGKFIS
jgi:hypothetical protein